MGWIYPVEMAINREGTWRSDEQLLAMLDERAEWTVNGSLAKVLATTGSLRDAITEAQRRRKFGQRVTAVTRRSEDMIIVFYAQADRLIT